MLILGINGSPRSGGSSELLMDEALRGARDKGASVVKINVAKLITEGCRACGGCSKSAVCVIDDGISAFHLKIERADAVVIAAPIFFGGLPAQLKSVIDRCQPLWVKKYKLKRSSSSAGKRPGIFLCTAGLDKRDYFKAAILVVDALFQTLDVHRVGELFVGGIDKKKSVAFNPGVLKKAYYLGASLVKAKKGI